MRNPYRELEKKLGYRFRRRRHLEAALTHRSYRYEAPDITVDNQRLEFLGDAALGLVAGAQLFERFPDCEEGDLTRMRSRLTNTKTLARIASSIQLGEHLLLGRGEQQSGGHKRTSNLGDALEAVLGAAYLDGGVKAVSRIFDKLFGGEIEATGADRWQDNPKGALQEVSQRTWRTSPRYHLVKEEGPAHARHFTVEVVISGNVLATGHGTSKRDAETDAATQALHRIQAAPVTSAPADLKVT